MKKADVFVLLLILGETKYLFQYDVNCFSYVFLYQAEEVFFYSRYLFLKLALILQNWFLFYATC